MLMNQPHVTVVGVTGPIAIVSEIEQRSEAMHGIIRMLVIEWIAILTPRLGAVAPGSRNEFRKIAVIRERIATVILIRIMVAHGHNILLQ